MMARRTRAVLVRAATALPFVACASQRESDTRSSGATSAAATSPDSAAPTGATATASVSELEAAAVDAVGFLQGATPFARLRLADSVTLHAGPDGGGGRRTLARDALRQRANWAIDVRSRRLSLVPSGGLTRLTTRVGRHFVCHEHSLAASFPQLAERPHVGTRLEAASQPSCLRTWNATFVFDTAGVKRRIVAVVYDQWEW